MLYLNTSEGGGGGGLRGVRGRDRKRERERGIESPLIAGGLLY